ncbi:MAG: hypothetical protein KDA71_04490 [Planctomycetales bacterium]|nr:hypothetical protein [Planctomycetales bacterium]
MAKPPRFVAKLTDGRTIEGNFLADWHAAQAQAKLESEPLFAPNAPLRWLRDRWLSPNRSPDAYIEFVNGDFVAGRVTGFADGEDGFDQQPPHALVAPSFEQRPPSGVSVAELRVATRFIRRIVWQRSTVAAEPNSVLFRDGRTLAFRSLRWRAGAIDLLTADGPRRVAISELAALRLEEPNAWDTYFDELVELAPDGESRLLQTETIDGLIATTSLARFDARAEGNSADFARWVHAVQPAWSLDPIWIPNRNVWIRRSFAPHEVPLTRFLPRLETPGSAAVPTLSAAAWQINRNAYGDTFNPGEAEAGWGIGVRSANRLIFPTHPAVRTLRTRFALDRAAGTGGCVRAKVASIVTPDQPWYTSEFVVGSQHTIDCGAISIPTDGNRPAEIILEVDAAHTGRPAGADPLTIRDIADWVEPWFELDAAVVKDEIARRRATHIPAWRSWKVTFNEQTPPLRKNVTDDLNSPTVRHRPAIAAVGEPIVLSAERRLDTDDRWLVVGAHRVQDGPNPPKLKIAINGKEQPEQDAPLFDRSHRDARPICFALPRSPATSDQSIELAVSQMPGNDETPLVWRCLTVSRTHPFLRCLFDEIDNAPNAASPLPLELFGEADPPVANIRTENAANWGSSHLYVPPDEPLRLAVKQPIAIRNVPNWGEFRFLRLAMRKPEGGKLQLVIQRVDPPTSVALVAGEKQPADENARVMWQQPLGKDWIVLTRDLYADLGECQIESITLQSLDDQPALFDHIYLSRGPGDFNGIPNPR